MARDRDNSEYDANNQPLKNVIARKRDYQGSET